MRVHNLLAGVGIVLVVSACGNNPGENSLLAMSDEPAGNNCTVGGKKVEVGLDLNTNGLLDGSEVKQTSYVCNGAIGDTGQTGSSCSVVDNLDGTKTIGCGPNNAVTVSDGAKGDPGASCSVVDNGNGTVTITCGTTAVTVAYGSGGGGNGSLVRMTPEPAGANCAQGGQMVQTGLDANGNGTLDAGEVSATQYVCNGLNGSNGTNGTDGTNGTNGTNGTDGYNSLVSITNEAPGANCTNGGKAIRSGVDTNRNGTLDAGEASATQYVCNGTNGTNGTNGSNGTNGTNGTNGHNSLVAITNEAAGANCTNGGKRLQTGVDANDNGTLDAGEVASTQYVCNGTNGSGGASIYGDGSDGAGSFGTANWITSPPSGTLQFTTLNITGTLTVPSGLIIRATGNVTISGSIVVSPNVTTSLGIATITALSGPSGGAGAGGLGGMSTIRAKLMVNPGPFGGASGAGSVGKNAGAAGGTIVIVAGGTITINGGGSVSAVGGAGVTDDLLDGGGGGGGGIVVMASRTSIVNSGTISVQGGSGGAATSLSSASGGGGGGIANLIAPAITAGTVNVNGGAAGSGSNSGGFGGGGGGSAGNGGSSGSSVAAATAGTAGYSFATIVSDPTSLFTLSTRPQIVQ